MDDENLHASDDESVNMELLERSNNVTDRDVQYPVQAEDNESRELAVVHNNEVGNENAGMSQSGGSVDYNIFDDTSNQSPNSPANGIENAIISESEEESVDFNVFDESSNQSANSQAVGIAVVEDDAINPADTQQVVVDNADMSDGIRLISELNELNALLNDLSGSASRIAEHLVDTVEGTSRSSLGSGVVDLQAENFINNNPEPVRAIVGQFVRLINARETGMSDGLLARLRRMVFHLDGRLQRRGLQLGEEYRAASLNSQSSNGTSNESQHDELSDDETTPPPNAVSFDTNLPAEHSYLGTNMSRVSGVNYLDAGGQYNIMLFVHQHMLFPGEILPFMISENVFENEEVDATTGILFGVCFPFMPVDANNPNSDIYGVTCHIYEKGTDATGNMFIKSRALQRFVYQKNESSVNLQYIASHPRFKCRGNVRILPEIFLPEPLKCINMGSMNRFRGNESMRNTYRRFQAASTPWPVFVYDYYSIDSIVEKARTKLAQHKINTMPTDPIQLSFWLVRNLHLSEDLAREIFATDSVNIRMKLIAGSFKEDAVFVCRYCGNRIAECRELFAMSKYGVQTQYCNSAGYIHETNTVYRVTQDAISFSGEPSTEFSWFPGYQWHIINCQVCTRHIGWRFTAVEPNLFPKTFYGITGSSVRIGTRPEIESEADINNVYRGIVRLARRHFD